MNRNRLRGRNQGGAEEFQPVKDAAVFRYPPEKGDVQPHLRLDALEAYNKRLVKKIATKESRSPLSTGRRGTSISKVLIFPQHPLLTAMLEFEVKGKMEL